MAGFVSSAFSVLLAAGLVFGGNRLVFTPKEDISPIVNPHKGFVQHIDEFDSSSSCSKLTDILYDEFSVGELKSGDGFVLSPIDSSADKCVLSGRTLAIGITAEKAEDSEAMKRLAKAVSARYDGSERIEFILLSLPEAEESVQKEILDSWDSAFSRTPLAVSSECKAYSYAASLGMFAYDSNAAINESAAVSGTEFFPISEESYNAASSVAETLQSKLGYNLVIKYASFYFEKNEAVLTVKIKNTGSAAADFPITLEAAVCDRNGTSFTRTGKTAVITGGSLSDGSEQTYELRFDRSLIPNKNDVYISVGAFEDLTAVSPDIKLSNKTAGSTNYVVLGQIK